MVASYIQKLIDVITNRRHTHPGKTMPSRQHSTRINNKFSFNHFMNDRHQFEHASEIRRIKKEIKIAERSGYKDVRAFYLKKAQSHCAEFLFHHPDTLAFNLIANLMINIDHEKEKNIDLFYDNLNEHIINLKLYAESTSKKLGLFSREPKREAIKQFFRDYPKPVLSDFIRLKASLVDRFRAGDADRIIDKIISLEKHSIDAQQNTQP